jgi:hypothetical protein
VLLGSRLELRRRELGHTWRTTFEAASGVNKRLSADVEKAAKDRVDHFMPGTFQLIAKGYRVTEESMLAVLRGEAGDLVPAAAAALPVTRDRLEAGPDGWHPPIADRARRDADAPYAAEIMERLLALADSGTIDPSGAQVFPDAPGDAKAWDGIGARLPVRDRVWFIADLRRLADGRDGNSGTGVTGA